MNITRIDNWRVGIWALVLTTVCSAGVSRGQTAAAPEALPNTATFTDAEASVNGVKIHYTQGGSGPAVVLLHGYAQTGHMWGPLMPELAKNHRVIVPDLRGAGRSEKAQGGYDKATMAVDIHELVRSLGIDRASVVGHDIGLMVAYAYAAQFPAETERVVLMDAFLPGIGQWNNVWLLRDKWHFNFYGDTPLALVKGRERTYLEHFWNDFAADPRHSVSEDDRRLYAATYAQEGAMRSGFEYFHNFEKDAADFAEFGKTKLRMPMLVLTGEKASGEFLIDQARLVATNVRGEVIKDAGHWLIDESPGVVIPAIVSFLNEPTDGAAVVRQVRSESLTELPGQRLTALTVSYRPGGKSGPHRHAGSVFAYVLSGAIRSENSATGPARVYRAGESFFEPAGSEHLISENASDTEPASLLAVFIAPEGSVLTTVREDGSSVEKRTGTAASLVDALNRLFGPQTTGRAVHAKGVVLEGRFTPDPAARALSRAPHFEVPVPVTVRFSNFAGVKTVADTDALANPRGMAVKFQLPDGTQTDLVMHSFNGFPAPTAEEFRRFLIALGTSGPGAAKPTPAETYLAAHPVAKAFLESQKAPPRSYATLAYFGVNSFKFTNAAGQERIGRYRVEPLAGEQFLPAEQIAAAPADYLTQEIRQRVASGPVRLRLRVQIAGAGDAIEDPSIAWPEGREFVELGVIELTAAVQECEEAERRLLFQPGSLPAGIEAADPMIELRDGAYFESFARRHREPAASMQNQEP